MGKTSVLRERHSRAHQTLQIRLDERKKAQENVDRLLQEKEEKKAALKRLERVRPALLELTWRVEGSVGAALEKAVLQALAAVYGEGYSFSFSFQRKNRPEVDLVVQDPAVRGDLRNKGGGVMDLVSESLRLALLLSSGARPLLVLDEKYKFVSADLVPRVGQMLVDLCADFGLQILLMSHQTGFLEYASKVFDISVQGAGSVVEEGAWSSPTTTELLTSG